MEKGEQLSSDSEEADVDIIGELKDDNTGDGRFPNDSNSRMARPENQNCAITDDDGQKQSEDESLEVDIIGDGSLPKNPVDSANNSFHAQRSNALSLDHLDPQPGPSGIYNETNHVVDIDSDSDDSVKIIEIPRKPVPVITVLDSSDDEEIDVVQVIPKKTLKAKKCPEINPPKTIKEKLEEQREKLFPVKTEENETGKSPSTKHDSMCSICLGNCENRAFLDQCFHSFCYTCIIQWANIVHTCPLCKTSFKSIIHDVQPDLQHKQDFMKEPTRPHAAELPNLISFESFFQSGQRFRYRTTMSTMSNQINDWHSQARYEASRNRRPSRSRWGRQSSSSHHTNASEERRRSIYRLGMIIKEIKHPPGRVRFRDTSLRFFKDNPAIAHRLVPWILRDLKVILDNNGNDASFVLHLIMSLLVRYPLESNEFHTELQPFLLNDTRQFIRELISFASSPYDMRTYDSRVVYDMPSAVQAASARNNSTMTSSTLQRPSNIQPEREISFQERLVDELFAGSRIEVSPPLTRSSQSPGRDDILGHSGWNTDDSEIEITRIIPVMQGNNRTMSSTNDRNDITRSRDPRNDITKSRNQRNDIAYVGEPNNDIIIDCENMPTGSSKKLIRSRVSKDNNRHSYFTSGSSSSDEEKSRPGLKPWRADTSKQNKGKGKRRRRSRSESYSRRRSPRSTSSRSNLDGSSKYRASGRTNDSCSQPRYRNSRTRSSSKTSDYLKGSRRLERSQAAVLEKERRSSSGPRSRSREYRGSRSRSRHRPKSRPRTRSRSPSLELLGRRGRGRTPPHRSRFDVKERYLGRKEHRSSSKSSVTKRNGTELCYSPDSSSGFSRNRDRKGKSRSPGTRLDHRKDDKNRNFSSLNVDRSRTKASETQRRGRSGTPQEESFLEKMMKDAEQNESSSSSGKTGAYSRNHLLPSNRRSQEFKEQPQFDLLCDASESDDAKNRTKKGGSRSALKSSSSDYVKKHKNKKRKKERKKDKENKARKRKPSNSDTGSEVSSGEEVISDRSQSLELEDVAEVICPIVGVVDCDSAKQSRSICQSKDHSGMEGCDTTFINKEDSIQICNDDSSVEIEEIKTRRKKKSKKQHKHKRHKHKRDRKEQDAGNFINLAEEIQNDSDKELTAEDFFHKPSDGGINESDCQTVSLDMEISCSNRKNRGKTLNVENGQYEPTTEGIGLNQSKNARLEIKHTTDILTDGISDLERTGRGDDMIKDGRPVDNGIDDFGLQESSRESLEVQNETDIASMKIADLKWTSSGFYVAEGSCKQQKLTKKFEKSCNADVVVEDHEEKTVHRKMKEKLDHSDTRVRKCSGSNVSREYERKRLFLFPGSEEQNLNGNVNGLISRNESRGHGPKDGFGCEDSWNDITAPSGNTTEKSFEIIQKDVKDALNNGVSGIASSDNLASLHQIDQNSVEKLVSVENIRQLEQSNRSIANQPCRRPRETGIQEDEESSIKPIGGTRMEVDYIDCRSESCKGVIDERLPDKSDGSQSVTEPLSVKGDTALHESETKADQDCLSLSKEEDSVVVISSLDGGSSAVSELQNVNREPSSFSLVDNQPNDESFAKRRTLRGEAPTTDLGGTSLLTDASLKSSRHIIEMSKKPATSVIPPFGQQQDYTLTQHWTLSSTNIMDLGANSLPSDAKLLNVNKQSTSSNDLLDKGNWGGTASKRSLQSGRKETNLGAQRTLGKGSSSPTVEFIETSTTSSSLRREEQERDSISTQSRNTQETELNLGTLRLLNTGSSSPTLKFIEKSTTSSSLRREEQERDSISTQSRNTQETEPNLGTLRLLNTGSSSPTLEFIEKSTTSSSSRREEQERDSISTQSRNTQETELNLGTLRLLHTGSSSPTLKFIEKSTTRLTDKQRWENIFSRRTAQSEANESFEGSVNCFLNNANSAQMLNLDEESGISNSFGNNEHREIIITERSSGDRKLILVDQKCPSWANDAHLHINDLPNEEITPCLISPIVPVIKEKPKIYDYDAQIASQLSEHDCTKDSVIVQGSDHEATENDRSCSVTDGKRKVRIISKRKTDSS